MFILYLYYSKYDCYGHGLIFPPKNITGLIYILSCSACLHCSSNQQESLIGHFFLLHKMIARNENYQDNSLKCSDIHALTPLSGSE